MKFLFRAPSGNEAQLTLINVGNRWCCDYGWRDCPPSAEDMRAGEKAAELIIASQTGTAKQHVSSAGYSEDEEQARRDQRAFLGGGQG